MTLGVVIVALLASAGASFLWPEQIRRALPSFPSAPSMVGGRSTPAGDGTGSARAEKPGGSSPATPVPIQWAGNMSGQWAAMLALVPGSPTPPIPAAALVFKDPLGGLVTYIPPAAPTPSAWQTYSNQQDGYSISYPSDWIKVEITENGHEGLALHPPGTKLEQNSPGGPPRVSVGLVAGYVPPAASDRRVANRKDISLDGVRGEMFTTSALGKGITAAFQTRADYLVLEADADSEVILSLFFQILRSVKFTS